MNQRNEIRLGFAIFVIVVILMTVIEIVLVSRAEQNTQTNKQSAGSFVVPKDTKPTVGKALPSRKPQKRISRAKERPMKVNSKAKRYALTLVSSPTQMACLLPLWEKESGWSATSDNPTSSAYGIPQILGLEARTGDDYKAQVRAGLGYIKHRYGTPCRAWAFWQNNKWY
jgi:hypothetical protein